MYSTGLLGRFAPIFYFNREYVLFVHIEKQINKQKFSNFLKSNFVRDKILKI